MAAAESDVLDYRRDKLVAAWRHGADCRHGEENKKTSGGVAPIHLRKSRHGTKAANLKDEKASGNCPNAETKLYLCPKTLSIKTFAGFTIYWTLVTICLAIL